MNDLQIIVLSFVFGIIVGILEIKYKFSNKLKFKRKI